jgi:hypothetical protein
MVPKQATKSWAIPVNLRKGIDANWIPSFGLQLMTDQPDKRLDWWISWALLAPLAVYFLSFTVAVVVAISMTKAGIVTFERANHVLRAAYAPFFCLFWLPEHLEPVRHALDPCCHAIDWLIAHFSP